MTITFQLTANDDLNNKQLTIEKKVNFIKALKIDDTNIKNYLGKYSAVSWRDLDKGYSEFKFDSAEYKDTIYTLTSQAQVGGNKNDIPSSEVITKFTGRINGAYYGTPAANNPYFKVQEDSKTPTVTDDSVSFSVDLQFTDYAESTLTSLSVKFARSNSESSWKFTN